MSLVVELHLAHQTRLRRIDNAAKSLRAAAALKHDVAQAEAIEREWAQRQKAIPLPKEVWFSAVDDVEPCSPLSVKDIQRATAAHFHLSKSALLSACRCKDFSYPRQVGMYLARKLTMFSTPAIGRHFGGRDHTTVLHAIRKIERLIPVEWEVAFDVAHVEAILCPVSQ